jgi:undecaprenyl-diphosphatase
MSYLQIMILALIQGLAELLPISSSAHVILAERLMGENPSRVEHTFLLIMLHTGTMLAVLIYFWPRWRRLLLPARSEAADDAGATGWHFVKMVILATLISGVLGYGLIKFIEKVVFVRMLGYTGEVEDLFKNLPLIGTGMFLVGILILVAGTRAAGDVKSVSTPTSIWIGVVQAICLPFRGFSRSGATISAGLLRRLSYPLAEEFSFALAVAITPPAIGRELYRLLRDKDWHGSGEMLHLLRPGLLGMVFSLLAGLAALRLLSAILERGRWKYFGYYCIVAALVVFGAAYAGY